MKTASTPFSTGCHVLIADGLKGTDEALVPVAGGEYVKEAKIGRAIMDADVFISLTHFKGHEATGFGGALEEHRHGLRLPGGQDGACTAPASPTWTRSSAWAAAAARRSCAHGAITITRQARPAIDHDKCVGCGRCIGACPIDAVCTLTTTRPTTSSTARLPSTPRPSSTDEPSFHISLVVDVSPYCDCHSENDAAHRARRGHVRLL